MVFWQLALMWQGKFTYSSVSNKIFIIWAFIHKFFPPTEVPFIEHLLFPKFHLFLPYFVNNTFHDYILHNVQLSDPWQVILYQVSLCRLWHDHERQFCTDAVLRNYRTTTTDIKFGLLNKLRRTFNVKSDNAFFAARSFQFTP